MLAEVNLRKQASGKTRSRMPLASRREAKGDWHVDPHDEDAPPGALAVMVLTFTGRGTVHFAWQKNLAGPATRVQATAGSCYTFFNGLTESSQALSGAWHNPMTRGNLVRTVMVARFEVH